MPFKFLVKVSLVLDVTGMDEVVQHLMSSLNNGIGLRVLCGNELPRKAILIVESITHFGHELSSLVHDYFIG